MKNNILITGVSFGIGNYLVNNLVNNYNIFGVSRTNPNISQLNFRSLDLKDFSQIKKYVESVKDVNFDTIIFNAGVGFFDKIENIKDEEIVETFQVNILSVIVLLRELLTIISPKTKLIFIGSVAGKKFFKYGTVYQASKFALRGFTGSLRNELKNKIHLINPQFVDTGFFKNERIDIDGNFKETKVDEILEVVNNILEGKENRFEIDL